MAAGTPIREWTGPSRRRVPRFRIQAPVDVTILRSGIPDTVPARSVNVCERGISAVVAGELTPGESVGIEVRLNAFGEPLRTRATVRYQDKLRCGLEFVALSPEQRNSIRDWAKQAKPDFDLRPKLTSPPANAAGTEESAHLKHVSTGDPGVPRRRPGKGRKSGRLFVLAVLVIAAVVFLWWWNRGWSELETARQSSATQANEARVQVSADVMEKLLLHRVQPVYPSEAQKNNLQGVIALDVIISKDGNVISARPLNGPPILANAAVDSLRWWKFEPYRENGESVAVETTLAVEFKR